MYCNIWETIYKEQFNSLQMFVKLYCLVMALGAETYSVVSYYKTNKLIITQWNVNEFLVIVVLRREQNEEIYVE
jgi:hypothetical protein